jgi:hypothetical protein
VGGVLGAWRRHRRHAVPSMTLWGFEGIDRDATRCPLHDLRGFDEVIGATLRLYETRQSAVLGQGLGVTRVKPPNVVGRHLTAQAAASARQSSV